MNTIRPSGSQRSTIALVRFTISRYARSALSSRASSLRRRRISSPPGPDIRPSSPWGIGPRYLGSWTRQSAIEADPHDRDLLAEEVELIGAQARALRVIDVEDARHVRYARERALDQRLELVRSRRHERGAPSALCAAEPHRHRTGLVVVAPPLLGARLRDD